MVYASIKNILIKVAATTAKIIASSHSIILPGFWPRFFQNDQFTFFEI